MADLIDRRAALDAIKERQQAVKEWYDMAKDESIKARAGDAAILLNEFKDIIKQLPSAERKGEWIPASESLPEIGKKVLCLCQANIYEVLALTSEGWYHDAGDCYRRGFVVAWMPLPDKGGDKNGNV